MKRLIAVLASFFLLAFLTVRAQQPKVPTARIGPDPSQLNRIMSHKHMRGATPGSARIHKAFELTKDSRFSYVAKAAPVQFVPAIIPTPNQMSYWGNSQYGDCVTAEEFFSKCIYPVYFSTSGSMLDMPESLAISWAQANGFLNGADLTPVMDAMAKPGVVYDKTTYTDGPYTSVDYTTWSVLISAISQGPVKIGVASSQFDNIAGVGEQNGWVMYGFTKDTNEDHCVSLCGYGTMSYLATAMGVSLPSGVDGKANGLLLYTWDSIGLIDFASMNNITGEAWLRTPTTPQTPPPAPPAPSSLTYVLVNPPSGATIDDSGNFTWSIPATQTVGPLTVTFTVTATSVSMNGSFMVTVAAPAPAPTTITIGPIPAQTATTGSTFSLNVSKYVTVTQKKK